MGAQRTVSATQVMPGGPTVNFGLVGDAQLSRYGMASMGMGGWQIVDRPRQKASTEWVDYSPFELDMSLVIDGYGDGSHPVSVEGLCAIVESWERPAPGSSPPEPPKLALAGPLPRSVSQLTWCIYIVTWKDAVRDPTTGDRLYQELSVTLFEYSPPSYTITASSPAAVARSIAANPYAAGQFQAATTQFGTQGAQSANAATAPSTTPYGPPAPVVTGSPLLPPVTPYASTPVVASTATYTVRQGDTLLTIAAGQLGNAGDWVQIAQLNGIRDPRNIKVGQKLRMPYVKGYNRLPHGTYWLPAGAPLPQLPDP